MFKPSSEHTSIRLEYNKDKGEDNQQVSMDLDVILEKMYEYGIESLSDEEKKFLDGFQN